jgi:predicted dehydrogenase
VPVLVEKPLAIGAQAVAALQARAAAGKAMLAASHVFLFTRYLEAFAEAAPLERATELEFAWADGQAEIVRGEAKSYDPAVSVFDGILPHVLPVLARLAGRPLVPDRIDLEQGGAAVTITALAGDLSATISLARNAPGRSRRLSVRTAQGPWVLDFSTEPGVITAPDGATRNPDPLWDSAPRPLATMLAAFLRAVEGGAPDPRLSPALGLATAAFADAIRPDYLAQRTALLGIDGSAEAVAYARQEASGQG